MATKTQAQKSTETAIPCDKCQYMDCPSIHDNVAPHCGAQACGTCSSFAQLNDEISQTYNKLVELVKQRLAVKTEFNNHHERPIDRLPFELISEIFVLAVKDHYNSLPFSGIWPYRTLLSLGGVCKTWRDITLRTPQLWTELKVTVRYGAPSYYTTVTKNMLHRSGSLPLSLYINIQQHVPFDSTYTRPFYLAIALLRYHSIRWNHLNIRSNRARHIHSLLSNLPSSPGNLESLSIEWCDKAGFKSFGSQPAILFPKFISLSDQFYDGVGLWDVPCGLERLTRIELCDSSLDEVLYFIQHSPNLNECIAKFIQNFDDEYHSFPLPTARITSRSLTHLETGLSSEIFLYLILPSLQTLVHECRNDLDILTACLDMSSPPLEPGLDFTLTLLSSEVDPWYGILPAITSLYIDALEATCVKGDTQFIVIEDFLAALARPGPNTVLSNLESLSLTTCGMTPASWYSLCDIFEGYAENDDMVLTSVGRSRLKEVDLSIVGGNRVVRYLHLESIVFERFENLKNAGVELTVRTPHGPEFGRSASV